jgi:hypothetical protein
MIRNINDRGTRGSHAGRRGRSLTTGAILGVALSAFVVLGWLPGKAAFFAGFGPALAEFKPPAEDLMAQGKGIAKDPVAGILSHWEFTLECGAGGAPGCPAVCLTDCPTETSGANATCCASTNLDDPACTHVGGLSCWGCCPLN